MPQHTFLDVADLRIEVEREILAQPGRRAALRRANAETIAAWLRVSRRTLFSTLARLGLTLGDLQRERLIPR